MQSPSHQKLSNFPTVTSQSRLGTWKAFQEIYIPKLASRIIAAKLAKSFVTRQELSADFRQIPDIARISGHEAPKSDRSKIKSTERNGGKWRRRSITLFPFFFPSRAAINQSRWPGLCRGLMTNGVLSAPRITRVSNCARSPAFERIRARNVFHRGKRGGDKYLYSRGITYKLSPLAFTRIPRPLQSENCYCP